MKKPTLAPADLIEPAVVEMANGLHLLLEGGGKVDAVSSVAPAIYSVAISAKRQADALERIADQLATLNQQDMMHPEWGLSASVGRIAQAISK